MALFTKEEVAHELRAERMFSVLKTYFSGQELSDDYLYGKVLAAQRDLEVALRVYLEPVEVLPFGATAEEIAALVEAGKRYVEEPGYDMGPDFWRPDSWAYTVLRHAPVIDVHSIRFVYPAPASSVFEVPADWIRLDRRIGHLRLVPTNQVLIAPLFGFLGPLLTGGTTIPQMLQVRYSSGLQNVPTEYPDVMDILKKKAVLSAIQDQWVPGSKSQSIDGMSQSVSFDLDKSLDTVEKRVENLRNSLTGIRVMVI